MPFKTEVTGPAGNRFEHSFETSQDVTDYFKQSGWLSAPWLLHMQRGIGPNGPTTISIEWVEPAPKLSIRDQIADAAEQGKPIGIHYRKVDSVVPSRHHVETRKIVPTRFKEGTSGTELVVAFDLDREEPRPFRLDRIEGVEYDG